MAHRVGAPIHSAVLSSAGSEIYLLHLALFLKNTTRESLPCCSTLPCSTRLQCRAVANLDTPWSRVQACCR